MNWSLVAGVIIGAVVASGFWAFAIDQFFKDMFR